MLYKEYAERLMKHYKVTNLNKLPKAARVALSTGLGIKTSQQEQVWVRQIDTVYNALNNVEYAVHLTNGDMHYCRGPFNEHALQMFKNGTLISIHDLTYHMDNRDTWHTPVSVEVTAKPIFAF